MHPSRVFRQNIDRDTLLDFTAFGITENQTENEVIAERSQKKKPEKQSPQQNSPYMVNLKVVTQVAFKKRQSGKNTARKQKVDDKLNMSKGKK